ncbi:chromosome segregation protein SMC [Limosilactobacillus reuteri]|uniref:AAA family ATPase n=1 Tax=Limosilactobacillus reuteri TaxID=1598 RepID=UPI000B99BD78|nr:SMC family ATPase [Limosilactobacillus reuteri]OYS47164.1 chromosome segregation protein SMC [Limosilactobacillus reuteri]OYS52784.1 chromosome segregation protein SMC [Limosilactobacillus reuteri]
MRPLTIELHYFGPYEHQVIDFTQFTERSLFLVAGNTGAGKTTIFDAMCYALFGQTTNDRDRSAAALRSDFAPADQETMVKFTFEHQDLKYQIMRRPKQVLKGRRGKSVEHNQAVDLIYPLESDHPHEITKIKEADMFITDLLNLTRDQFKQIVLLPQGKFRQFLDSDSNTKEALLRDLFNTSCYEQWATQLKKDLREQKKSLTTQETKLQSLKETVTAIDTQLTTKEWLAEAKNYLSRLKANLEHLGDDEQQQQKKVDQLDAQLHTEQELKKNIEELAELIKVGKTLQAQAGEIQETKQQVKVLDWYQEHQTEYQRWKDGEKRLQKLTADSNILHEDLRNLQKQQQTIETDLQQTSKQQEEIDQLQTEVADLTNKLPLFDDRDKLKSAVDELQANLKQQKKQQAASQKKLQDAQQQLTVIANNLKEHENLGEVQVQLAKKEGLQEKLTTARKDLKQLETKFLSEKENCAKLEQKQGDAEKLVQKSQGELDDLNDRFARHQIAILAQKLKPATPCPICGSLDHPHPASLADDSELVTEAQVKAATVKVQQNRSTFDQLKEQVRQSVAQIANLTTEVETKQANLAELLGDNELPSDWEEQIENHAQKLAEMKTDLDRIEQQVKQWRQEEEELQQESKFSQEELDKIDESVDRCKQDLIAKQTILKEKAASLPAKFTTKEAADKQIQTDQLKIEAFNNQLESLQQQRQENAEKLAGTSSRINQTKEELATQMTQQDNLHQYLVNLLAQYDVQLKWDFWQEASEQVATLSSLREQVTTFENQVQDNQSQQERLTKAINNHPMPDIALTQTKLNAEREQLRQCQQEIGQLTAQYKQLEETDQKIIKAVEKTGKLDQEINELQTLTDVVTGNTENHVSLERYVLQAYFQEVLVAANVQLDRLTNGRYQFELATESHGAGAKWSGLEVNVYDDNAGRTRSARTLSGGESFMASLALALALCQIVQEQSGGIKIDALFIDEGFGSLDQQALEDALHSLQELEGHRMIGIISHITELEEQIPDQLIVRSRNGRSYVAYQHEI